MTKSLLFLFFTIVLPSASFAQSQDTLRTKSSEEFIGEYLGYSFGFMKMQSADSTDHLFDPNNVSELILASGVQYDRFLVVKGELYMSGSKDKLTTQQLLENAEENLNAASVLLALGMGAGIAGVFLDGEGAAVAGIVGGVCIIGSQITLITGAQKTRKALKKYAEGIY